VHFVRSRSVQSPESGAEPPPRSALRTSIRSVELRLTGRRITGVCLCILTVPRGLLLFQACCGDALDHRAAELFARLQVNQRALPGFLAIAQRIAARKCGRVFGCVALVIVAAASDSPQHAQQPNRQPALDHGPTSARMGSWSVVRRAVRTSSFFDRAELGG